MALILVVFSLFPSAADLCARLLGIYSTPNFLFLSMIFLLLVKVFTMTLQVSQLESKQKELVQKMALEKKEQEELLKRLLEAAEEKKEKAGPEAVQGIRGKENRAEAEAMAGGRD